jgi:hypothetical protein
MDPSALIRKLIVGDELEKKRAAMRRPEPRN